MVCLFVGLFAVNKKSFADWDIKANVCVNLKSAPGVDTIYKVTLTNAHHNCATFAVKGDFDHEGNYGAVYVFIKSTTTSACTPYSESGFTIRSYGGVGGRCAYTDTYFTTSLEKGPYVPGGYPKYIPLRSPGQQWFQMVNGSDWIYQKDHPVNSAGSKFPPTGTKGLFFSSDSRSDSYSVSLNGSDTITMTYFPDGT